MMQVAFTDTELLLSEEGKLLGKIEFSLSDNTMTILHTYSYESGRVIGTILMQNAVSWAKERHYTIVPVCSFAQKYLKKDEGKN